MRTTRIFLSSLVLAGLALVVSTASTSSAPKLLPSETDPATLAATRFSSAYTPLTKCGSGLTKKEEREAAQQGSDIPTRCKGYGGYDVYIYYSACASILTIDKGEENIPLGMQALSWTQKTVEWRLANGKPFAVIIRMYDYANKDLCTTSGSKIKGSSLLIKGLKGYDIDETVDTKSTPNANVKARELADAAYAKIKSE
jgi:hypothetical protein